ncbi:MAG: polysaccharide deacetylase family protein [Shinella sp.]|uniref:polysaccharide deacetylase family protein n=1 Tax=Shinella sp. TaxID=1870904 RepID=UPI00403648CE
MTTAATRSLQDEIARRADIGKPLSLWLRDDDAVEPTEALDHLLALTAAHAVPVLLAVIPALTGEALVGRLARESHASVAVHGWAHKSHASSGEKNQELGPHRPEEQVLAELGASLETLATLHAGRFVPMLVPPWNRIAPAVVAGLPGLGFEALSVFGPEKPAPLKVLNTHVDIIDWRGTRGGRAGEAVIADLIRVSQSHEGPIGLLTHHLVHDSAAWDLMAMIFEATAKQSDFPWHSAGDLLRNG